jgi:hypothetical protein
MKSKMQILDWIILIAISSTLLYIVSNNIPTLLGSFRFFWAPITLSLVFLAKPDIFYRKIIILLLLYGLVFLGLLQYTFWSYMSDWNVRQLQDEFYALFVFSCIWAHYWSINEIRKLAIISKWSFLFIVITIITTHIALYIEPTIVRSASNSFRGDSTSFAIAKTFGTVGYGYAQSLVLLIPILVYFIKTKKRIYFNYKILFIILIVLILLLLRANVFANVLIAIPIIILAYVGPKKGRANYGYITFLVLILAFIPISIYANLILNLSNYFGQYDFFNERFTDLASFFENPNLDTTSTTGGRVSRYPLLFEAFIANPLGGDASYFSSYDIEEGGHLYWMNKLAIWGIIGFFFFIYILYILFKNIISVFDYEFKYYYHLSLMAFIGLGLTKNISGREPWLLLILIIPGLYFLHKYQKIEKVKVHKWYDKVSKQPYLGWRYATRDKSTINNGAGVQ